MRYNLGLLMGVAGCVLQIISVAAEDDTSPTIVNQQIDMAGHLQAVVEAAEHREARRLTEDEFLQMSKRPSVKILDARSQAKFEELHIKGAINLSFPDITVESLQKVFPDKNTTILIYCNNNFEANTPAFPIKSARAALNLSTYATLYTYGYRNVYELGPVLDVNTTKLELVGTLGNPSSSAILPER